jgi:hypothetical protein
MEGTGKPLIFIKPMSDAVAKLKDVIAETAEEEGIDIYELESEAEIAQIVPLVGQSLCIFSHPKKCALNLQPLRKQIAKLNTKVILLARKNLPRKTMDKFTKIGLTECIVEPVPPKTLLYKVNLLLRSIIVELKSDDEMEEKHFGKDDESSALSNEAQRVEKGIIFDGNSASNDKPKNKNKELSLDADEEESKKSNYLEEMLQKNWKGGISRDELTLDLNEDNDDKDKDEGNQENYIDSYMRGKKAGADLSLDEEDLYGRAKNDAIEEEEEEESKRKSKATSLELSIGDDESGDKKNQTDVITDDKFYKGKLARDINLEMADETTPKPEAVELENEEADKKRNNKDVNLSLDLAPEEKEANLAQELDQEEDQRKRDKEIDLSMDFAPEDKSLDEQEDEEEQKRKSKEVDLGLSLDAQDDEEKEDGENDQELEAEEKKKNKDGEEVDHFDKYMKGKLSNVVEVEVEEERDARNRGGLEADLEFEEEDGDINEQEQAEEEDTERKRKQEVNLAFDGEEKEQKDKATEEEDSDLNRRIDKEVNLEFAKDSVDEEDETPPLDAEDDGRSRASSKNLDLQVAKEDREKEKTGEEDERGELKRREAQVQLQVEADNEKKHHGFTENIQGHYDSRKAIKHQEEYDWDNLGKKERGETIGLEKKKKSILDISFAEKVDLGEQTIDYRKLHSEFEAITINRAGKKKHSGPKYYGAPEEDIEYLQSVYGDEWENALEELKAKSKDKIKDIQQTNVFQPDSKGLENAIKVMNLYHNKSIKIIDIFNYIANSILKNYNGHTFFFILDNDKTNFNLEFKFSHEDLNVNIELLEKWDEIYEEFQITWLEGNLPEWKDGTFQDEKNWFFYPVYEGAKKLGFAVVLFTEKVDEKISRPMEVTLETTRGIVLEKFYGMSQESSTSNNSKEKNSEIDNKEGKEDKGFFKSFFGKFSNKAS